VLGVQQSTLSHMTLDTSKTEADGGKWMQLEDGRTIEYFLCAATVNNIT
jgi:hypothetical protein